MDVRRVTAKNQIMMDLNRGEVAVFATREEWGEIAELIFNWAPDFNGVAGRILDVLKEQDIKP